MKPTFLLLSLLLLVFQPGNPAVCGALVQDSEDDAQRELAALNEVSRGLPDPALVTRDLDATTHNVGLLPGYRANIERIRQQFAARFARPQQPWSELESRLRWHENEVARFEQTVREHVASLAAVQQELETVRQTAKMAIENQAPVWFQPDSELYQRLATARKRLAMVRLLDGESDETKRAASEIDRVEQEVSTTAATIADQILENTPLPPDEYQGADREKLLEAIAARWKNDGNGQQVVRSGIVGPDWKRETAWVWENRAFHKTDTSRIQAWVLVAHGEKTLARHSLNFVVDHLAGDSMESSWVGDPKADPPLSSQVLRSRAEGN